VFLLGEENSSVDKSAKHRSVSELQNPVNIFTSQKWTDRPSKRDEPQYPQIHSFSEAFTALPHSLSPDIHKQRARF
jgi:hypothetical protein